MRSSTDQPVTRSEHGFRRWTLRWWELAPDAALIAALTFFFFDEMDAATSAFKSGRALTLMAIAATGWVAASLFLARYVRWPGPRLVLFGVAAAATFAVVVLPAYRDHKVVETIEAAVLVAPSVPTAEGALPPSSAPEPDPRPLRTGTFRGIDHRATGTVNIYQRVDGRFIVGLEDFDIQPGPDYDVYVVPGADRRSRNGGTRVDDLRGNAGTQFYDVSAEVDLGSGPWTVLVWCQTFGVPVANATPT
jgi:hypothetical protein